MPFSPALVEAAQRALVGAKAGNLGIVTAESCTSGLFASVLSEAPGCLGTAAWRLRRLYETEQGRRARGTRGAAENEGRGLRRCRVRDGRRRTRTVTRGRIGGRHGCRRYSARRGWKPDGLVCIAT